MFDRKAVGERLKVLRGTKTLKQVAVDLNVSEMAISLWERGERIPNDDMKIKIAQYYNQSVAHIFFNQNVNDA